MRPHPPKLRKSQQRTKTHVRQTNNRLMRLFDAAYERQWAKRDRLFKMPLWYILRGKEPVPCNRIGKWGRWFHCERQHIGEDRIGEVRVSTIFLGIDHGLGSLFNPSAPPTVFETMIFGGKHDSQQWRYKTWNGARYGHVTIVEALANGAAIEVNDE